MADADRGQLDRSLALNLADDLAQMLFEIIAGVDRQRRIVDRRAVRDDHQDLAFFGPAQEAVLRPGEGLAVDILLQDALAPHQPQISPGAAPRRGPRPLSDS